MKIDFNILVAILLVGTVQGFITSGFLLMSKHNRRANLFLALLVLGFSLQSVDYFLNKSGLYIQHIEYYFLPIYYSLSFGPLIYLYVTVCKNPYKARCQVSYFCFITLYSSTHSDTILYNH